MNGAKNEPVQNTQQEVESVEAVPTAKNSDKSQSEHSVLEVSPGEPVEANNGGHSVDQLSNTQTVLFLDSVVLVIWGLSKIPPVRWVFKLLFVILDWAFGRDSYNNDAKKQNSNGSNKKKRSGCVYCG